MAVEQVAGATVITGEHTKLYRLLALKHALRLEIKGLKRRGTSTYQIVKREFGFRGNRQSVLDQLTKYIRDKYPVG